MKKIYAFFLFALICLQSAYALEAPRDYTKDERQLIVDLYEIGILNFDKTSWNSTYLATSPYYADFRHIISYPDIFARVIALLEERAKKLSFDAICAVPYAALPMAANLAYVMESPLIMRRTNRKNYGTGKKIEGVIIPNMRCLVVEDVVSTATSLFETIHDLEEEKIAISDCIILFDREQGGVEFAREKGYALHTIFTISDFVYVLHEEDKIDTELAEAIIQWTRENQMAGLNWKE